MSISAIILTSAWCVFLLCFIFLLFAKAYFHFDYFKAIYPDELSKYDNYFTARYIQFNNRYIFRANVPFFKREMDKEKSIESSKKADRVELLCKLIYLNFLAMIITLTIIAFVKP